METYFINETIEDGIDGSMTCIILSVPRNKTTEEKMRSICNEMKNTSKPRFNQKIFYELWINRENGIQERIHNI